MEVSMSDKRSRPRVIPAGLKRCPQCGEFRGRRAIVPSYRHDRLEIVPIRCLCEGIVCRYCRKHAIHRPISNYYVERTGRVWHVPYFGGDLPCEGCWQRAAPTAELSETGQFETRHMVSALSLARKPCA